MAKPYLIGRGNVIAIGLFALGLLFVLPPWYPSEWKAVLLVAGTVLLATPLGQALSARVRESPHGLRSLAVDALKWLRTTHVRARWPFFLEHGPVETTFTDERRHEI